MRQILFIIIVLLGFQSCKQATDDDVSIEIDCPKAQVNTSTTFNNLPALSFEMTDYKLVGNSLRLSLALSGCSFQRNFRLVVNEAKSKSLPPQQDAKLIFDEQSCQAYFEFEICFDVSEIERPTILKIPTSGGIKSIELN